MKLFNDYENTDVNYFANFTLSGNYKFSTKQMLKKRSGVHNKVWVFGYLY